MLREYKEFREFSDGAKLSFLFSDVRDGRDKRDKKEKMRTTFNAPRSSFMSEWCSSVADMRKPRMGST